MLIPWYNPSSKPSCALPEPLGAGRLWSSCPLKVSTQHLAMVKTAHDQGWGKR